MFTGVAYAALYGRLHLAGAGYRHAWNRADADGELHRGNGPMHVLGDVLSDFRFDPGESAELGLQVAWHPDPGQILVIPPVAEPAAHLQQRVVLACRPEEIAD